MADGIKVESSSLEPKKENSDQEFLALARKRFQLAADAENDNRVAAIEDLKFSLGEQWDPAITAARKTDNRPCLVINKMPGFIRQITNDQRQNRPAIKVRPVDDQADVETAKIRQGLIRHIENDSGADVAYDTAFDFAVRGGFPGYIRAVTEYCDPMSFDQELKIKQVQNPLTVYRDPFSKEPDGSDANFYFVIEDLPAEEFKAQFPKAEPHGADEFTSIGDHAALWRPGDAVRVAEYLYKDWKDVPIVLLNNAQTMPKAEFEKLGDTPEGAAALAAGLAVEKERVARVPTIRWAKMTGLAVLERGEWAGKKYIPMVPVFGEVINVDGKVTMKGLVRDAKDPQKQYNYFASAETETIALAPRAPFIGAAGQFKGREGEWKTANTRSHAFLQYEPVTIGGQAAPPPQRQVYEPAVQAVSMARGQANEELKSTTGIYDASLGNKSNETSGVAIQRRNAQAQTSNFHFFDNLTRSLRQLGRILDDAIPYVYDTGRAVRILGEGDEQEVVRINEEFQHKGEMRTYDMRAGKYDVVMETGPSYATKRQEAAASMMDLATKDPQLMAVAGDIIVKSMDWPGATDIAERLKKTMDPKLVDDGKNKPAPLPPEVQQQLQGYGQMVDQLTKQLHDAKEALSTKRMELESKEKIAMLQEQTKLELGLAQIDQKDSIALLQHQIAELSQRLDHSHALEAAEHGAELNPVEPDEDDYGSAGPSGAAPPEPTGGQSPGQSMEQP